MNPFKDAQLRAGAPDLETLQHQRRTLVEANKRLLASREPLNVFDARRKILVSVVLLEVKAKYDAEGKRFTEKVLEAEANADPRVRQYVDEWEANGAMAKVVELQIKEYDEMIQRGNLVIKQYTNEPHGSR